MGAIKGVRHSYHRGMVLPEDYRERLRAIIARDTARTAGDAMGMGETTLLKAVSGFPLRPSTFVRVMVAVDNWDER